ncbi:PREDICTED: huntingtin-interacting protein 1-related protein-like [Acropora digitifera]|uniref:huntingtin-interacting protein 1-related protein-like n=1 Tax=Acropora digitifera TaxID=70779 RepID=UPI00077ABBCB|nr:PREDICTED: huntingtin-interacting protein 1-related protein-like [Acropora digitifera]
MESMTKQHEEKIASLNSDLSILEKNRTDEETAKRKAEGAIEKERKEHQDKISALETERLEELSKEKQDLLGMALQEAQKTIQDALDQFANPKHNSTTCTADYLLSRIDGLPQVVDELESKFSSYRQDHKDASACVRCVSSFSRHLGECILNAKATSHMAPTQEATGLQSLGESAGKESLELLELYKLTSPDPSAIADKVNAVKKHISDITKVAEALVPKEKDNMDSVGGEVEDEINATAELVADSAARIEEMLNKTREKFTGVQLEVNGRYCHFVLNLEDQGQIDLRRVWFQLIGP